VSAIGILQQLTGQDRFATCCFFLSQDEVNGKVIVMVAGLFLKPICGGSRRPKKATHDVKER
jgi:hypothetical protein